MTLLALYPSKKNMKEHIGEKLMYQETSMFGPEYQSNGQMLTEELLRISSRMETGKRPQKLSFRSIMG